MTEDDDRERPKKSWREIDAQRDRSPQTTRAERDREHGGNKTRTAETLGITREGLHKKLAKYGM